VPKEKPVSPKETPIFTVNLSRSAEKFLDRLPDKHFGQIDRRLEMLKTNPRPHDSIQLTDRDKERRFDIGEYRVLYEIDDEIRIVNVFKIAPRKDKRIYKKRG
jgi:mRNA interferase RelE/StbE